MVLARNTLTLYGQQIANAILPLILVSWLARVTSIAELGEYFVYSSLSVWIYFLVEFGFNLSATRQISQARNDPVEVSRIASSVMAAQGFLWLLMVILAAAFAYVRQFTWHQVCYLSSAVCLAGGRAVGPLWYFQGTERFVGVTAWEMGCRAAAVAIAVLVVRGPTDGYLALMSQAALAVLASAVQMAVMLGEVRLRRPSFPAVLDRVRSGLGACVYRLAGATYASTNVLILAIVSSPQVVGFYGGAERITRGLLTFITPVCTALYPRVSLLLVNRDVRLSSYVRWAIVIVVSIGCLVYAVLAASPRLWVLVLLGTGHEPAERLLRVLAVQCPFVGVSTVLTILALLPHGAERAVNSVVLGGALFNATLGFLLGGLSEGRGMAWTAVGTEALIAAALLGMFGRRLRRGSVERG